MAIILGDGLVSVAPSAKGFKGKLEDEIGGDVDAAGKSAGDRFGSGLLGGLGGHLAGITAAVGGAFAAVKVGGFLKDSIGAASDLGESMSKVNVVFGESAPIIQEFAANAATTMGQSTQQALEATGTFGNLFRAIGLGTPLAADMSTKIVTLAGDLASFNNANPEDVLLALRAGLVGETEPLRQFGVNINEARLKAEAFRLGLVQAEVDQKKFSTASESAEKAARKVSEALAKHGEGSTQYADAVRDAEQANNNLAEVLEGKVPATLDAATKAQASYSLIMQDTSLAQGDFARTSDGLANKSRILSAQFTDLKGRIGAALLPAVTAIASAISERLLPGIESLGRIVGPIFKDFARSANELVQAFISSGALDEIAGGLRALVAAFRDGGDEITSSGFAGALERIGVIARNAFDVIRNAIADIDLPALFQRVSDAVAPVIPKVVELAQVAGELGGKLVAFGIQQIPTVVSAFETLMTVVGPVLDVLISAVSKLVANFDTLKPVIIGVVAAFATFKAVEGTNNLIASTTTAVGNMKTSLLAAKGQFTTLGASIKTAATSLATWAKTAATAVVSAAKSVASSIASVATSLYASAQAALVSAANWVRNTAAMVAQRAAAIASAVATKAMTAAQWLLNAAMTANPIGILVVAIAALVAGFILAWQHSETFRNIIIGIGEAIMGALRVAIDWITGTAWPALLGFLKAIGDAVVGVITFFKDLPGTITGLLADIGSWLYDKGVALLKGLWEGLVFYLEFVKKFYIDLPLSILEWLGDTAAWLVDKGIDILKGLLNGIIEGNVAVYNFFNSLVNSVLGWIGNTAAWLVGKGKDILVGMLTGLYDGQVAVMNYLFGLGTSIVNWVGNAGRWLYDVGVQAIQGLINGILDKAKDIGGVMAGIGNKVKDGITGALKVFSPSRVMMDVGENIVEGLNVGMRAASQRSDPAKLLGLDRFGGLTVGAGVAASSMGPAAVATSAALGGPLVGQLSINEARTPPGQLLGDLEWALRTSGRSVL